MKKTATTAGGTGMAGGVYAISTTSYDWYLDNIWLLTLGGFAITAILGFAVWKLWQRVKALEANS